ncbi:MAG: serine/threonine protein kinase, partial [Planctomycetota bacterium]
MSDIDKTSPEVGDNDISRTPDSRFLVSATDTRIPVLREYQEGERITNRYVVERVIGSGGMGSVYLVSDAADTTQLVALKHVGGESNPVRLETFRNEFRTLTKLNHENLARVFDFGVLAEKGGFYYTAEYIDGPDLNAAVSGADEDTIVDYIIQICRALEYVHTRGYVHYDVKPKNILVTGNGKVKLMDFGLSALAGRGLGKMIRGTPAYTAPEVISRANVDARADLYSLGISIYEIFTAKRPFRGLKLHEVLTAHVTEAPKPLSSVNPGTPKYIADIVQRLLAKNPLDRFDSANSVIRSIAKAKGMEIELQTAASVEGYLKTPPLKARNTELELVRGVLDAMSDTGKGFHQAFIGTSGIGRTRLLKEVHFEAQLHGFAAAFGSGGDDYLFEKLAGEVVMTPGIEAPEAPDKKTEERDKKRKGSADALPGTVARILAVAEQKPVVLSIDDAHAANASNKSTLNVLSRLLSIKNAPPVFLATTWPDTQGSESIFPPEASIHRLKALTHEEVGEVVTEMFGKIPAPEAFVT